MNKSEDSSPNNQPEHKKRGCPCFLEQPLLNYLILFTN